MSSKENINVHLFPKNAQEAIAFEYMKRRASNTTTPVEDMVDFYFEAKQAVDAAFKEKQQNSSGSFTEWK
ncbi:hypothetical protein NX776_00530 [Apilactobacillus kunkeei]|uniref:hypothetical protein n=1 Tax=Apilactobacillus kunkeei TaxID=148814 RepID=UPI002658175F|nr:hypothetical protein [Apilactobacillus kunkeei]MCX0325203.1 hypothetical protein [Apilactobacillus kunkeei]